MRSLIERLQRLLPQEATLVIEAQSLVSLSLRSGRTLTVFDRLSRAVTQNGRQVATFGSIHDVRIGEMTDDNRRPAWLVTLRLAGSRDVLIGRSTQASEASLAAGQIATITGSRVF